MRTAGIILTAIFMMNMMMETQANERKTVRSKLDEVTVFFHGAELKHSAEIALTQGENEVWIEGLSTQIDAGSLNIRAGAGIVISAYEFVPAHVSEHISDPVLRKLRDSLVMYQKKGQQIDIEMSVHRQMLELLEKGMTQKMASQEKGMTLDELSKSMEYFKDKHIEIETLLIRREEEKKRLEADIARITGELKAGGHETGALKLSLTAPSAMKSRLAVSYCTFAAGWSPYYHLHVESIEHPVQIVSKARVRQTTGVDWKRVKLTLSTGAPGKEQVAPLFNTWFLREWSPMPMLRSQPSARNTYAEKANMEMAAEEPSAAKAEATVDDYLTVDENALVTTYAIDLPYTIPGNGKEQNIDLRVQQANATYRFYAAPKLDTRTYLTAELTESEKLDLPSGKAMISYDDMYLGETYIDGSGTLQNMTLTLGTDQRISVKREKMQDFSSTRLFGSDVKQVFTFKITVKNNQKKEIKLTLKDQYPISTQKNIEVELLKETTPPTTNKADTGVLTWEDTFQPGETKSYQISYSVKYPKGMQLNL